MEVAEEDYGLLFHISDGDQGLKWIVGGVVGASLGVNQAIHCASPMRHDPAHPRWP